MYGLATLLAMPLAFVLPVVTANIIQDFRGVPQPNHFDGVVMSSFCAGFILLLVVGVIGLRLTATAIKKYYNADTSGHCLRCGYPVHSLPRTSYECPECGFVIPKPKTVDH